MMMVMKKYDGGAVGFGVMERRVIEEEVLELRGGEGDQEANDDGRG